MKLKILIGCILVAAMLSVASPALALSLGVSPTQVELEVSGDSSITTNVNIHYFDGDIQISLIDIPLRIEPEIITVEASELPIEVELTIYGDSSLGSKVYNGYIRFIAVSGGAATGGVQVIAKVTNIVEGKTPIQAEPSEELEVDQEPKQVVEEDSKATPIEEEATLPASQEESEQVAEESPAPPVAEQTSEPLVAWPIIAGMAVCVVILISLIIVFRRRIRP